jgi:translation initiation factor 2B subunit (eIF-2B alpha/beta/delta family)
LIPSSTSSHLTSIQTNRVDGSASLSLSALQALKEAFENMEEEKERKTEDVIRDLSWHFMNVRPSLPSIEVSICAALSPVLKWINQSNTTPSLIEIKENLRNSIQNVQSNISSAPSLIGNYLQSIVSQYKHPLILTHSNSGTVRAALSSCKEMKLKVICTESRPLGDANHFVSQLLSHSDSSTVEQIQICNDASMEYVIGNYPISVILVGADSITKGKFVNKIGKT